MPIAFTVIALTAQLASAPSPHDLVSRALRSVERDSAAALESRWSRELARSPGDRSTLFGLASLARFTYRHERADSLYARVVGGSSASADAYSIAARIGSASMLANGRNPALADSTLSIARRDARRLGLRRLEAEALTALASVRARSVGTRAALDLIAESRRAVATLPPRDEALRSCAEGSFASRLGDAVTERRLALGAAMARNAKDWRAYAECALIQAQIYEHRGYFDRALQKLDTAVYWMRRTRADGSLAIALQWGAFVRYQDGDLARSKRDYLESVVLARRTHNVSVEAWALTGLGQTAIVLGDLSGGREHLSRAMVLHQTRNDRWGYATVRELEGELNDALGDVPAARASLTEAVNVQTQLGQQLLAIAPLRRLARLELAQGRVDDADRALEKATRYATASRSAGWPRELPYHLAGSAIARERYELADSLLHVIELQAQGGSPRSADLAYNFAVRYADLASRRGDWREAERWMERALLELERWRGQLADKDVRLRVAQARRTWGTIGDEFPSLIARLAHAGRVAPAFALSEAARARELTTVAVQRAALVADASHLAKAVAQIRRSGGAASLAQVQSALDDTTAMLAYVAGRGRAPTTVFIVTRRGATARLLAPIDSIARPLERYLRLAADGAEPSAPARQLGDALLADAIGALPPAITRLIVVPELTLYRVPFDALVLPNGRFAIERFTVSVAPSATYAVSMARAARSNAAGALLAFGDASYGPTPSGVAAMLTSNVQSTGALPRLPYSGDEARRVARYARSSRVLVRAAANESALRRADLRGVRVLHFATHAMMDDRSLPRNMLVLSPSSGDDGLVGPEDLSALSIDDALVVLSGCRTVGGVVLGGEGLRGLTAPLLEAGARAVVATHWAIGDESILPFVDRFYAHMASGADVGTALRSAKTDAIRDNVRASVWAAFSLIGDGTMRVRLRPISSSPLPWVRAR